MADRGPGSLIYEPFGLVHQWGNPGNEHHRDRRKRVDSGRSPGRARKTRIPPKAVIETSDDQPLLTIATAYLKAIANSQFVLFSFLGGNMFT
jgi:hypothetical protein